MPKTIIDYSKTIIYRIVCRDLTIKDCYVGHTTNFIKRKQQHKNVCNNPNSKHFNCYVYKFIRNNGGWENWDIILIDTFNCNDLNEACKKEREHIELYNATLNSIMLSRKIKEYNEENNKKINKINKKVNILFIKNNMDKLIKINPNTLRLKLKIKLINKRATAGN